MYIGADFLIDRDLNLYLSEVNTGVPAGAQEFDLVYREKFGEPSGVFRYIESLSLRYTGKNFFKYIHELPYMDDLRALKIWMDGEGPLPKKPAKALRLEDKWIQYLILSDAYPMIPTELFRHRESKDAVESLLRKIPIVVKKRFGRGGRGFLLIKDLDELKKVNLIENVYIMQPYLESSIGSHKLSIRAAAFMGHFVCMFASLNPKLTSNHGIRFFVSPGDCFKITNEDFTVREIVQKSWEADIFYKGNIPDYLYHDVYEETIAEAELIIPERLYRNIQRISASISQLYKDIDFDTLPKSIIE